MKRVLFLLTLSCALFRFPALAQTALSPEQEEKIKRLSSDMETLYAANAELQKKITALNEELAKVHEQMAKSAHDSALEAMREDLKKIAEKVQEVDRKRLNDSETVAKKFDELTKFLKAEVAASSSRTPKPPKVIETTPAASGPSLEYIIKPGDTLSEIVDGANAQFKEKGLKKITLSQVLEANPKLKPERMQVGQKIIIPIPEK